MSLWLVTMPWAFSDDNLLRVEVSGCASVSAENVCTLNDSRTLTVWVEHGLRDSVSFGFDGNRMSLSTLSNATTLRVLGGTRFKLDVPKGVSTLSFSDGLRTAALKLESNTRPKMLETARTLNREGKLEESILLLNTSMSSIDPHWAGAALRLLGQAQRRLGHIAKAEELLSQSVAADMKAGKHSDALRTSTVIVYTLMSKGDFKRAREVLNDTVAPALFDADSAYNLNYFFGLLAYNTSNTRTALTRLNEAALQAQRTGTAAQRLYAELLLAVQLQRVGRGQEALAYLSRWSSLPDDIRPCEHSLALTNMGWAALLLLEAGRSSEDPTDLLVKADELAQKKCGPTVVINTRTNLALARWHANDLSGAQRWIEKARDTNAMHLRSALWLLDIEARIALDRGDFELAHRKYDELQLLAKATLSHQAQWRALAGHARTYAATGDREAALNAYMEADWLLLDVLPSIPIDQGREALLTARSNVTNEHIALLLDVQRYDEAFALAREARRRALNTVNVAHSVEQLSQPAQRKWEQLLGEYHDLRKELEVAVESAWMLPADELVELAGENATRKTRLRQILDGAADVFREIESPSLLPPRVNELLVLVQKLPTSWALFTHDGTTLRVTQPSCLRTDLSEQMECLLETVFEDISAAPLLRMLVSGAMAEIDVHALRVKGQPLVSRVPVVYGLDIASSRNALTRGNRALLVADAGGDLAAARRELNNVADTLTASLAWSYQTLVDEQVQFSSVLENIQRSDLFHFAGHARFAGEYGWGSELKLGSDSGLGISDVLTLEHSPPLVVLSGCETAKATSTASQSMSLANAFLLAGSQKVLAASRPVRDDMAHRVIEQFYSHWIRGQAPEHALRLAQIALIESHPQADWAAYRLISR
ncbi:MAG: CHAT domain-containing protein [Gammaproteobacteria bacterium]